MAAEGGRASTVVIQGDSLTAARARTPRGIDPAAEWTGLAARLLAEPFRFDFFQAVRLLHHLFPERPSIGRGGPPSREPVRFRSWLSMSFPASAIQDLSILTTEPPIPVMTQSFMGLFGPSGILPRHYTELLVRLQRDSKGPERILLRDWFDLFNHRLVSLFFRSWQKYRFVLAYERLEFARTEPDLFTTCLLSLVGLGMPPLRNRLKIIDGTQADRPATNVSWPGSTT